MTLGKMRLGEGSKLRATVADGLYAAAARLTRALATAVPIAAGLLLAGCYPLGNIVDAEINRVANPPSPQYQEYCDKLGGLKVKRVAENVDGFVLLPHAIYGNGPDSPPTDAAWGGCFTCLDYLARDGYSFVEAAWVPRRGPFTDDYAVAEGLYRYSLVPRTSGLCARFDELALNRRIVNDSQQFKLGDRCVYAERIPAFTAQYEVALSRHFSPEPRLTQIQQSVRDRRTGEVLVELNIFFTPNNSVPNFCHSGDLHVRDYLKPRRQAALR